jgi:ribosomal protein S18 acetylase RimI-like enzyme
MKNEFPMQAVEKQPIEIEHARSEDAEAIFNVQRATWLDTYPNKEAGITGEDIRKRIEGENGEKISPKIDKWRQGIEVSDGSRAVFVAREEGKVVGYVAPAIIDGQRRIGAIYVLPDSQGKGIGSELLHKAIEWHGRKEDIFLRVATYNQKAIDFYKRNGFKETNNVVEDEAAQKSGSKPIPEIEMVLGAEGKS